MTRKQRRSLPMPPRSATPPVSHLPKATFRVTDEGLSVMRAKPATRMVKQDIFKPYEPIRGVLPEGIKGAKIAMDAGFDAGAAASFGALENISAAYADGYAFPGFAVLSNWAQVPEFRRPAEVYAREMTRKWIKIQASGEVDKSDKIKKIEAEFKRLNVQAVFREAIEQDGKFGRSQIFIDTGIESDQLDVEELKTELAESPAKVGIGAVKRLTVIEPIWSYPNRYNANDPLDPTFYKPTSWFVMGKEVHSSRLLTIITRDVPDILKPAYAFAGLSLSQMIKPYVDNWLRTRQSVSDLIHAFTVWTLKTDMSTITTNQGLIDFYNRLQMFNLGRDNHGVNAINKDTEEFDNISAPLASLDKLQAQSQEQMCAPAGLPLVYLTGITPAGLNASSQDEIEIFQDTAAANQEIYTPALSKILNLVQLSLFGEIDPEIGFEWQQLKVMTAEQKATIRKLEAETDVALIGATVLAPDESRTRIANEEDSPYHGLELNVDLPDPPEVAGGPLESAEKESGVIQPEEAEETG
jgi:phage-related protein (TIGR01555 family)